MSTVLNQGINPLLEQLRVEQSSYNDVLTFTDKILDFTLYPQQSEVLKTFYSFHPDGSRKFNEIVLICGNKSTKTTIASIISCFEAFRLIALKNPGPFYGFPPGKEIYITNVAVNAEQAHATIFAETKARINNSPWFLDQKMDERYDEFQFYPSGVHVKSEHSNSSSLTGWLSKVALFDEIARFKDTKGKSSADWVYTTLSRTVKPFKTEGVLCSLTSPVFVQDYGMQLLRKCGTLIQGEFTKSMFPLPAGKIPTMLGIHRATWEMNPNLTRELLQVDFDKNPEAALRDYGAVPSASFENYFKEPWRIDDCVDSSREVPVDESGNLRSWFGPIPNTMYFLAGDPAVKNDSFGLSMIHVTGNLYTVDLIHQFKPKTVTSKEYMEVDASEIFLFIQSLVRLFPIRHFVTDIWNFPETIQRIAKMGVKIHQHHVTKSEYDFLKELIYAKKISFYTHSIFLRELKELELMSGAKVDHPRGGSKDVSDSVANACFLPTMSKALSWKPPSMISMKA